ncbi:MAG: alpha/beta hydrolase [Pseudomonadota bacterium]
MASAPPMTSEILPPGIRTHHVANNNGLVMHVLEAGADAPDTPVLLLLHGFPELAYSWRKVMVPLAEAGFRVIAPDQRGYGRSVGWTNAFDCDLAEYRILNLVCDQIGLLSALGIGSVHGVIGHDFGSPVAAACALARPDLFPRVALMSAPFAGAPGYPIGTAAAAQGAEPSPAARAGLSDPGLNAALSALDPPRKHYQWYYSTREANANMHAASQGLHAFLRAYYHHKSADWAENKPYPLAAWTAEALAVLPTYYIMDRDVGMAETVAPFMPTDAEITANTWLPDTELAVYTAEYQRTGFQGGLNWYRCVTGGLFTDDLRTFAGRTIDVPATFISGKSDWGTHQKPGDFEAMTSTACSDYRGTTLIDGAGHWVQQEQPAAVVDALMRFLRG